MVGWEAEAEADAGAAGEEEEETQDERAKERIVFYKYHSEGGGDKKGMSGIKT